MSDPVLLPVQLQAFVLNPAVCNTGEDDDDGARIIPITQPNYTFLRLDNYLIQNDVLNHIDMHNTAPAMKNSRMTDLGARPAATRRNRQGVYLHWILPQAYRSGVTASDSVPEERRKEERLKLGLPELAEGATGATNTPEFLQPPTRWIVVRKLDLDSIEPQEARSSFKEYQAWVIESDYRWALDDIPLDYDLEVDVSPFVVGVPGANINIQEQAEVFIGRKTPLEKWKPDPDAEYLDITILRSNNEFFADYQIHNSNVFSMLDNFQYDGPQNTKLYLEKANASYYLFGWHAEPHTDPFWDVKKQLTHETRLESLYMTLKSNDLTEDWLKSSDPTRLCCHGAMYDVKWDHDSKPAVVPADEHAKRMKNPEIPVVSVGTSPLDALVTYCAAHKGKDAGLIGQLEEDILAINSLLHARDDGVEGQREAKDTVYNWNFSRSKGGTHFFLGGEDSNGKPIRPSAESISALEKVNELQQLLDALERMVKLRRWDMFSLWWKFATNVENKETDQSLPRFKQTAEDLAQRIGLVYRRMVQLQRDIDTLLEGTKQKPSDLPDAKKGAQPFYYRGRDPTVLIGGIESGWPSDFSDNVNVRLPAQVFVPKEGTPPALDELISLFNQSFPSETSLQAVPALLKEFYGLQPRLSPPVQPPSGHQYPQFHEISSKEKTSRDEWGDRQPWFPLFVEWEVEYFHVPFEDWTLGESVARVSDNNQIRYGVDMSNGKKLWETLEKHEKEDKDKVHDTRILSGRILILPQPSFSLKAKVTQLFSDTPPDILKKHLKKEDRDELLANIDNLPFLSCPLSGITEGLLTLHNGTHVKPENKQLTETGEDITAIRAAVYDNAGLTSDRIELIMGNSAMTPYANSVSFTNPHHCPFKPVTHGQMRFRKLNVIDKFGQAVVAIDPQPRVTGPPPIYPCISDFYEPQHLLQPDETCVPNTVLEPNRENCEFIQLPPQINQNARLNADFVMTNDSKSESDPYWRPATEWENPIWGWIVTNYADYGIQLFLANGTFYGEIRIGGVDGTLDSPKWSPFAPPENYDPQQTSRLNALIERLQDATYIKGFWTMLTAAIDSLPPAPSAYAQFLGSVVGKPFALANMGWSLELDGPPLINQSLNANKADPDLLLIDPEEKRSYSFQVKLGDKEREYDGLIGYFEGLAKPNEKGEELQYDYVNTYFSIVDKDSKPEFDNLHPILAENYPKFRPYYCPPFSEEAPYTREVSAKAYAARRNEKLQVFGAIFDPFTAIHAYSSFLPAQELALRPWTWQDAMRNMVAFLHAGPLTLVQDVAGFAKGDILTIDKAKQRPAKSVGLPALQSGEWNWLQPYVDPDDADADLPLYNAFDIDKKGNQLSPGFEKTPYTAIEGFLQLRRPMMSEKPDAMVEQQA